MLVLAFSLCNFVMASVECQSWDKLPKHQNVDFESMPGPSVSLCAASERSAEHRTGPDCSVEHCTRLAAADDDNMHGMSNRCREATEAVQGQTVNVKGLIRPLRAL